MMAVFSIALIFSSTVPIVTLAAFLFLGLRHVVDCLQLLTYFRREIDSSGKLISTVTNTVLLFVIMYQMCMMGFFIIKKRPTEAMATCLILVISIMFTVISYEEVYDLSKINLDIERSSKKFGGGGGRKAKQIENMDGGGLSPEAFSKWKNEYEHPLVVGSVRRKANTLGIEVKTHNDWQQFLQDKEVRNLLVEETK
jgi:hypothetical protein